MTAALRVEAAAEVTTGKVQRRGGDRRSEKARSTGNVPIDPQANRAKAAGISVRTQRKLDRLAKVRPDLLAEVRTGRLSAHAAALKAGIIRKDERAGSSDAPDQPPWRTVREALDRLVGCPVSVERLAADIPLHRVASMARNARAAIPLLAALGPTAWTSEPRWRL
jgi:hypothetical protein